jgi:iron complex outermembrane receptor protein
MRHLNLCVILLLLPFALQAQDVYSLNGRVMDDAGQPLPGANVYLPELERGSVTNMNGEFRIQGLAAGRFILQISFVGYEMHIASIQAGQDQQMLTVQLHPATITADEVVISGGRHSTQHENAIKIELLKSHELKRIGSPTLVESLAELPGVDMISRGGSVSTPVIRGLSTNNILLLNNGFRMENYQFSADHPYLVDGTGLEQVEVIKGPASLLYGSDAIGGVINLVHDKPAPPGTVTGDADVRYFSNTAGLEGYLGMQGNQGRVSWGIRGGYRSHQDYRGGDGKIVPNSRFNGGSLKTYMGLRGQKNTHRLAYEYQQWKPGMTNEASAILTAENDRRNKVWYQDLDNHLVMSGNHFYLHPFKLQANFSYQHNHRRLITAEPDHPQVNMQLNTFGYELRGNLVTSEVSEFTLALQGHSQANRNGDGEIRVLPDYHLHDLAVFGLVQHDFENDVHLQVGFRFDNRFLDVPEQEKAGHSHGEDHAGEHGNGPDQPEDPGQEAELMPALDRYFGNVSGSLGVTWQLAEGILLRGNLASAYRSPNVAELTQDGEHGIRYEQGNRDLKSQRNYELDASIHLHRKQFMLDLAAYYNHINHYIFLDYTSDTTHEGLSVYRYVQHDARIYGAEAIAEVLPVPWLGIKAAYHYTRGKQSSSSNLPFIPHNRLRTEIRWMPGCILRKGRIYLKIGSELAFRQDRPASLETTSDSYHLLHAGIGISFPVSGRSLSFDIQVRNLLDKGYIDHLSTLKTLGYSGIGRNIMMNLSIPLLTSGT